jgi:hypothetical protein
MIPDLELQFQLCSFGASSEKILLLPASWRFDVEGSMVVPSSLAA